MPQQPFSEQTALLLRHLVELYRRSGDLQSTLAYVAKCRRLK